ncbi:hypothetical protein LUZ60_010662 [Juncus effusus]|nr:hypothetical protein LUZ60_010662 [Juncus effusus]
MKILFLICLLFASSRLLHASHGSLEETCKKVTNSASGYEFCVTSLQVVPGSQTANVYNLTVIVTELVKTNLTYAYTKYQELSKQSGWTNDTLKSFHVCLEVYSDASMDMDGLIGQAKSKDYYAFEITMTGVHIDVSTCDEAFEEGGEKTPIPKIDNDLADLAGLALAFANFWSQTSYASSPIDISKQTQYQNATPSPAPGQQQAGPSKRKRKRKRKKLKPFFWDGEWELSINILGYSILKSRKISPFLSRRKMSKLSM